MLIGCKGNHFPQNIAVLTKKETIFFVLRPIFRTFVVKILKTMRKVIGIGETVLDIIFRDDQPIHAVPGGSTFNAIISLGRCGVNTTFISETGNDHVGRMIIKFLKENNIQILTAQLQDSELYYDTDMKRGTAIVMGTEATGLTDIWRKAADAHIRIPMLGITDSLNVSVSAAILLYEAVRQRKALSPLPH